MEDPWGDPWTTDSPAKPDLPVAPRQAYFAAIDSNSSPRRISPDGASPWNDNDNDDAWGRWNDSATGKDSPGWGLSPGLKPLGGTVDRQPSPDPWGGLGPVEERQEEEEPKGEDEKAADSAISPDEEPIRKDTLNVGVHEELPKLLPGVRPDEWGAKDATGDEASTNSPTIESDRSASPDVVPEPAIRPIDQAKEDGKPSKVQELVEMYDGIAKKGASSTDASIIAVKKSPLSASANDDATAEAPEMEVSSLQQEESGEVISEDPTMYRATEKAPQAAKLVDGTEKARSDAHQGEATQPETPMPPRIPYPIDLSLLDDLFPSTPATSIEPELVPDVIIHDTFRTTSERKAWYHISRYGSIRQHNSGGIEGYVRIRWTGSQVREQTLKIVRRWMEEDSIGGRVVLGRRLGTGGASMFNWDSDAPPVEISELLKKKESTHAKRSSAEVKRAEAAFGWSSNLPASPTAAVLPAPAGASGQDLSSTKSEPPVPESTISLKLPAPPKPKPTAVQSTNAPQTTLVAPEASLNGADAEDDDDDWGEMVSSPTVPSSQFGMALPGVWEKETTTDAIDQSSQGDAVHDSNELNVTHHTAVDNENLLGHDSDSESVSDARPSPIAESTHSPPPLQSMLSHPTKQADATPLPLSPTANVTTGKPREPMHVASDLRSSLDDDAVFTILRGLPDLSYMLR